MKDNGKGTCVMAEASYPSQMVMSLKASSNKTTSMALAPITATPQVNLPLFILESGSTTNSRKYLIDSLYIYYLTSHFHLLYTSSIQYHHSLLYLNKYLTLLVVEHKNL
jgi:hypothetical protein